VAEILVERIARRTHPIRFRCLHPRIEIRKTGLTAVVCIGALPPHSLTIESPLPPDTPSPGPHNWAAIAHDYAENALTVTELCALHSLPLSALYQRIKVEGWVKRSTLSSVGAAARGDLAQRMLLALDHKMTRFETRMRRAAPANATAADSERDARTLGTLVRLFDKLKGFGAKTAPSRGGPAAGSSAGKDFHDADSLRHDLARRLEGLRDGIGG